MTYMLQWNSSTGWSCQFIRTKDRFKLLWPDHIQFKKKNISTGLGISCKTERARQLSHRRLHYNDVKMSTMASQITSLTIACSTVYSSTKKTSKLRVTGLCAGNSLLTGEFPAQMASNAKNVSSWWRHHDGILYVQASLFISIIMSQFRRRGVFISRVSKYQIINANKIV